MSKGKREKVRANPYPEHLKAMRQIRDGADVFAYGIAGTLREVERLWPELITITEPMGKYSGVGQLPYFGAILTPKGQLAILGKPYTK